MKAFAAGALTAMPITALIMWWVFSQQQQVDAKTSLAMTKAEARADEFNAAFNADWERSTPRRLAPTACTSSPTPGGDNDQRRAELRDRIRALEAQVYGTAATHDSMVQDFADIVGAEPSLAPEQSPNLTEIGGG